MLKVCEVSIDFRCSLDKFLEEVCDSRYREGIIEGVVRVVAGLRVKERWFLADQRANLRHRYSFGRANEPVPPVLDTFSHESGKCGE
jgi:hypothetical protein